MVIVCSKELAATYDLVTVCFFFSGRKIVVSFLRVRESLWFCFRGSCVFFFLVSFQDRSETIGARCEPDLCFRKRMNPSRDAGIKDGVSRRERRTGPRNAA